MDDCLGRYDSARLVTLSNDRRRATLRVLTDLRAATGSDSLLTADAATVGSVLATRAARGDAPGTLRKHRAIMRAYFEWACGERVIDAESLLADGHARERRR